MWIDVLWKIIGEWIVSTIKFYWINWVYSCWKIVFPVCPLPLLMPILQTQRHADWSNTEEKENLSGVPCIRSSFLWETRPEWWGENEERTHPTLTRECNFLRSSVTEITLLIRVYQCKQITPIWQRLLQYLLPSLSKPLLQYSLRQKSHQKLI
jgi:hypothetical protein